MLTLATHEAHFTILREMVTFDNKKNHGAATAQDAAKLACMRFLSVPDPLSADVSAVALKETEGEHDQIGKQKKPFQFLHVFILREYLAQELRPERISFECGCFCYYPQLFFPSILTWLSSVRYDFERIIDDFVFLCFFVGNDFLPHLPTLEIREGAIELLMSLYALLSSFPSCSLPRAGTIALCIAWMATSLTTAK
jgi:5'-3' exoribonuclease 2